MFFPKARGKGLATAMCEHSQKVAIELGYNPRSALILLKKYLERKCLYSKCFEP